MEILPANLLTFPTVPERKAKFSARINAIIFHQRLNKRRLDGGFGADGMNNLFASGTHLFG